MHGELVFSFSVKSYQSSVKGFQVRFHHQNISAMVSFAFMPPFLVMSALRACITCFIRAMSLPPALLLVLKSQF